MEIIKIYQENSLIETKTKIEHEYKIGNLSLDIALPQIINELKTIVFLDGLDELHYKIRDSVFNDIKKSLPVYALQYNWLLSLNW